ncbi:CD5 antigen-like [Leucoraja erinacea]|uniref:CD5 antigen-like n=1 Tax=Leucoraja erinaceus TaxID=7782 RepID=UPI0024570F2C|nr:CD5 antigen-like [Leucoraja erinacea]
MSAPGYLLFVVLLCLDVSDTETQPPTTETSFTSLTPDPPIRLQDGGHRCLGRVELYEAGQWLSLCREFWLELWGDVLCRQLACRRDRDRLEELPLPPSPQQRCL